MKQRHVIQIIFLLVLGIFFSSCKNSNGNPLDSSASEFNWEGKINQYNEAYRDSILFNSDRLMGTSFAPSVYIMYKDGSGIHAKTTKWFTFAATWSPRKWKIFYIADTSWGKPARGLFMMDADGSNNKRLTPPSEDVWGVSCSPDGKNIAYIVLDNTGSGKMRIANPDGTNSRDITGFFGPSMFHTVTWSSDSRYIAFDGLNGGIGIVRSDGGGFGIFFSNGNNQCLEPNWSPDGTKIAFVSHSYLEGSYWTNIFYYEISTKKIYQVTASKGFDFAPHWSTNNKQIIFSSRLPGNSPDHLFIVNLDGSGLTQLTEGISSDSRPSW